MALAVAVTVGTLWAVGAFASPRASSPPLRVTGVPELATFAPARNASESLVRNVSGGPWTLLYAEGIDARNVSSVPSVLYTPWGFGCTLSAVGGGATELSVPAFTGNDSSGVAPWWILVFQAEGLGTALVVQVTGGAATPAGLLTGNCLASERIIGSVPSSVINSPEAAASAWNETGASYLATYSNATVTLSLSPQSRQGFGLEEYGPVSLWSIDYNGCDAFGISGNGSQPAGSVSFNASSDAPGPGSYELSNCRPITTPYGPPISSALTLGPGSASTCATGSSVAPGGIGGCLPGDATITLNLNASVVELGSVVLSVDLCSDIGGLLECELATTSPGPGALSVLSGNDHVLASTTVASGALTMGAAGWTDLMAGVSNSTLLTATDLLEFDLGTTTPLSAAGALVTVMGENGYEGYVESFVA